MKISETENSVTTLDVSARFDRNVFGGSLLRISAVVATVERGTFVAGRPTPQTIADHRAVLARLGWNGIEQETTRGARTDIDLVPIGCDSVDQVSRPAVSWPRQDDCLA